MRDYGWWKNQRKWLKTGMNEKAGQKSLDDLALVIYQGGIS
jgi:hypothetical protein